MPDILAVLEAEPQGTAGHRCKVGRWLDSLEGEAGHDELVTTFETPPVRSGQPRPNGYRTTRDLERIAAKLGQPMSDSTINAHRWGACRCAW